MNKVLAWIGACIIRSAIFTYPNSNYDPNYTHEEVSSCGED